MTKEKCPSNPIFFGWINEIREKAKDKENQVSVGVVGVCCMYI